MRISDWSSDVCSSDLPVCGGQLLVVGNPNALAVDDQFVAFSGDRAIPAAVHRVEVQQVRQGRRLASRIVDLHELALGAIRGYTQDEAAHAARSEASRVGKECVRK